MEEFKPNPPIFVVDKPQRQNSTVFIADNARKLSSSCIADNAIARKLSTSSPVTNLDSTSPSNCTDQEFRPSFNIDERQDIAKKLHRLSRISKKEKQRFARFFPEVASVDAAIKSFHCALVTDILYQGVIYITPTWLCFYSNVFGKRRIQIPFKAVVEISKKRTAMFIPNAVGVTTATKEYIFGSLISRENTYKIMKRVWLQWQTISYSVTKDSIGLDTQIDTHSLTSQANESNVETSVRESVFSSEEDSEVEYVDAPTPQDLKFFDTKYNDRSLYEGQFIFNKNIFFGDYFLCGYLFNCILELYKLPKTCLFLGVACILTVFLLISAMTFTLHLSTLQDVILNTCDTSFHLFYNNCNNLHTPVANLQSNNDLHSLHTQLVSKMDDTLSELVKLTRYLVNHKS